MKLSALAFSVLLLVGAGCMPTATEPVPSTPPPSGTPTGQVSVGLDGEWELVTFAAAPGTDEQDASKIGATLSIQPGTQLAAKICNSMGGEYVVEAGALKVEKMNSTLMFCAGLAGEVEAAFTRGLTSGLAIEQSGDSLTLRSDSGAAFTYARAENTGRIGSIPSDEESGEDYTYSGVVTEVDLQGMAVDGPGVIVIRTEAGITAKILVPSMGMGFCKAKNSIVSVSDLKVGQTVESRGSVGAETDSIVPCQSEAHYLRVIKK